MPSMQEIEWESPAVEPRRALWAKLTMLHELGFVPSVIDYYSACPWIVRSMAKFDLLRVGLVYTSFDFAETVGLAVSQDNSCRFCYAASRAMLRFMGYSEDRIRRLEQNLLVAELDKRGRLALEFARRVSRANPIPTAAEREPLLAAGFTADEIKEIAFVAAVHLYYNRLSTLTALPPQPIERIGKSGWTKVTLPLIGWYMRSRRRRGRVEALPDEARRGRFSSPVAALDGLPAAGALRAVIDDAWQSPLLSKRKKAIVHAVVARGLGNRAAEREARAELAGEGLDEAAAEQMLTHLGSPHLDPVETAIARVARESIWYRPAEIQRQVRALRERMSDAEVLEFIGVAALANMACRLQAALGGEEPRPPSIGDR
jgi:AhpD family alkylhydroperoxidase